MKCKEVLKLLHICRATLKNYVTQGKIRVTPTPGGRFIYNDDDVFALLTKEKTRSVAIYGRVSSSNQKTDLNNQMETLRQFCSHNGIIVNKEYKDICSGMSLDRKEFNLLLDDITSYKIKTVYVTYKDRLTRLSFEMLKTLFNKFGCEIVVLNEINNPKEIEKELFEEIISILHCFSMKMYSKRRQEKLKLIEKELKLETQVK